MLDAAEPEASTRLARGGVDDESDHGDEGDGDDDLLRDGHGGNAIVIHGAGGHHALTEGLLLGTGRGRGLRCQTRRSILDRGRLPSRALLGGALSPDELIERYDAVTREDVLALARRCLAPETMSFSAAGRVSAAEDYRKLLGMPE